MGFFVDDKGVYGDRVGGFGIVVSKSEAVFGGLHGGGEFFSVGIKDEEFGVAEDGAFAVGEVELVGAVVVGVVASGESLKCYFDDDILFCLEMWGSLGDGVAVFHGFGAVVVPLGEVLMVVVFDFTGGVFGFLGGGSERDVFAGEGEDVHVGRPDGAGIFLVFFRIGAFGGDDLDTLGTEAGGEFLFGVECVVVVADVFLTLCPGGGDGVDFALSFGEGCPEGLLFCGGELLETFGGGF